jgi:hypothetical protein
MKVRQLQQRDWDQLLLVATGYLPMTSGDLRKAMSLAIAAHADLIAGVRDGGISAELPRGRVTLFVPPDGGLALAFHPRDEELGDEAYEDLGPPEVTLEVVDPGEGSYTREPGEDSGVQDADSWRD